MQQYLQPLWDHRARCRRGQAPARRLSAHGKGHQLRERPVLHPRLGRGVRRLFCGDAAAHEGHDGRGRAGVRQRRRRLRAGGCGAYHLAIRSFDVRRAHRLARRRRTRRRRARSVVFGRSSEGPARALSGLADRLAAPLGFLSITRLSHFQVRSALISALLRQYSRVNRIRGKNRISK